MIITEFELRANWHKTKDKIITLPAGSVITPAARDFIRSKGIQVQIEGDGIYDLNKNTFANAGHTRVSAGDPVKTAEIRTNSSNAQSSIYLKKAGGSSQNNQNTQGHKPEHKTHLHKGALVNKIHPVIALRGQIDLLQTELIETQVFFQSREEQELVNKLEEIAGLARDLMVAEVKEQPFEFKGLFGYTPDELRERSHYPKKYYGIAHSPLSFTHGPVVGRLQYLRAKVREVELYANRAFTNERGECTRTDLVQTWNRLSSAFYILACEYRSNHSQEESGLKESSLKNGNMIPIGISNRHVHLSEEDLSILFGYGYSLTPQRELSQPGQFAAQETVTLVGPKGSLENVRILGPTRSKTQVELSTTDCYRIGVTPLVRDSGDDQGTSGCIIAGPAGNIQLERGVIVAGRHIHLNPVEAEELRLKDGDKVRVRVSGLRPVVFEDVLIRVSPAYKKEMHLDFDEGNAALLGTQAKGLILEGGQ